MVVSLRAHGHLGPWVIGRYDLQLYSCLFCYDLQCTLDRHVLAFNMASHRREAKKNSESNANFRNTGGWITLKGAFWIFNLLTRPTASGKGEGNEILRTRAPSHLVLSSRTHLLIIDRSSGVNKTDAYSRCARSRNVKQLLYNATIHWWLGAFRTWIVVR